MQARALAHLVLGGRESVDLLELGDGLRVLALRLERLAREQRGFARRLQGGIGLVV